MSTLAEYITIRQQRLALQKEVDILDQKEKNLKAELVEMLVATDKDKLTEVHGDVIIGVRMICTDEPNVENWSDLLQHIKETGAIDLLQKRITPNAVRQRWEEGMTIPGVSSIIKYDVKSL